MAFFYPGKGNFFVHGWLLLPKNVCKKHHFTLRFAAFYLAFSTS